MVKKNITQYFEIQKFISIPCYAKKLKFHELDSFLMKRIGCTSNCVPTGNASDKYRVDERSNK